MTAILATVGPRHLVHVSDMRLSYVGGDPEEYRIKVFCIHGADFEGAFSYAGYAAPYRGAPSVLEELFQICSITTGQQRTLGNIVSLVTRAMNARWDKGRGAGRLSVYFTGWGPSRGRIGPVTCSFSVAR